jgi:hypothetical protein
MAIMNGFFVNEIQDQIDKNIPMKTGNSCKGNRTPSQISQHRNQRIFLGGIYTTHQIYEENGPTNILDETSLRPKSRAKGTKIDNKS